ncbi:MAG: FAD:protein FMN transferase [Acidobacteriota bacterium]|nr:FAD:protein FMN transferase [Acidobacteriota bacterium]
MPSLDHLSPAAIRTPASSASSRLAVRTSKAMASIITIQVRERPLRPGTTYAMDSEAVMDRALGEFHRIEKHCSRFLTTSALSKINRRPDRWHLVPEPLMAVLACAYDAHVQTGGSFDPRVLDRLTALGYDRSFHLIADDPVAAAADRSGDGVVVDHPSRWRGEAEADDIDPDIPPPWSPRLRRGLRLVHLQGRRIDLGGIGKSVALRRASSVLRRATPDFLIDAGGDLVLSGHPSPGTLWRVGVEAPSGGDEPLAVLELSDTAVATSSVRVRNWVHAGRPVHHLIDPSTGEPGGHGLQALTVVHPDPVEAEVWAKTLFLRGAHGVEELADRHGIAALWVDWRDRLLMTASMGEKVIWKQA